MPVCRSPRFSEGGPILGLVKFVSSAVNSYSRCGRIPKAFNLHTSWTEDEGKVSWEMEGIVCKVEKTL